MKNTLKSNNTEILNRNEYKSWCWKRKLFQHLFKFKRIFKM